MIAMPTDRLNQKVLKEALAQLANEIDEVRRQLTIRTQADIPGQGEEFGATEFIKQLKGRYQELGALIDADEVWPHLVPEWAHMAVEAKVAEITGNLLKVALEKRCDGHAR